MCLRPITVLSNYRPDDLRSMVGYAGMVLRHLHEAGYPAEELVPPALFGSVWHGRSAGRIAVNLREIDRFILAPTLWRRRSFGLLHIIDHANAFYLNSLRRAASIVTVHDVVPLLMISGRLPGPRQNRKRRWIHSMNARAMAKADRLVCVSEATRRDLLELTEADPARVVVIRNALFQTMSPATPEAQGELRQRLGIGANERVVLHVGSNRSRKNRRTVVEAFGKAAKGRPDLRLVLVGPPSGELSAIARGYGVEERMQVIPSLPADDLATLYTTAAVMVLPSLYEGFGYPVLEAQGCDTPVICANAGSLPEVAGESAVLLEPMDVEGFASAITRILDDPAFAAELVRKGRANLARFDAADWFASYDAIYRELA
jgi:glycosyltransferase involved in cell wall biosynthesis